MPQLANTAVIWSDTTSPNNAVNAARLTAQITNAALTNGAVIDQLNVNTRAGNAVPLAADMILLGDSTQADTAVPLMVPLANLLLEAQRNGTQRFGGVAGGTANALAVSTSPASVTVGYVAGEYVTFVTSAANTGACTLNLDTRGAANLYSPSGVALVAGDLPSGCIVEAIFDGTRFQIVGRSAVNTHELAPSARGDTQQYGIATTQNNLSIAPLDSNGSPTFVTTIPTGSVVRFKYTYNGTNASGGVTLSVNGIAGANLLYNGATMSAGKLTGTGTTGTLVTAVFDGTAWQTTGLTLGWDFTSALTNAPAIGTAAQFAHGLSGVPTKVRACLVLVNITGAGTGGTANGYSLNDEIELAGIYGNGYAPAFQLVCDGAHVTIVRNPSANVFIYPKGGGAALDIGGTFVNSYYWQLLIFASL